MSLFKSGNPTLSENKFRSTTITTITDENAMTIKGTLNKFGFMLLMLMGSAFYSWKEADNAGANVMPMILGGAIGGLVIAIVLMFKKEWAPFLAPLYALLEGLFIGAISSFFNQAYPGIVMQAVGLTFSVGIGMYFLYAMRIIRATEKFKSVLITATVGIALFYFAIMILRMFSVNIDETMPFVNGGGMFGIGFSLLIVAIAALNLILDFDMIEQGAEMGAPKYMEWYGAFGLMVTFVWLYMEILRLLSKFSSRN
ncbi:MAG: Bax inhibitor-1/YccA family protein [Sphingobacteriales bacterium]|nr:Bax inhibitor-1/YccA family protein [Sphingobacteriales bacterium]